MPINKFGCHEQQYKLVTKIRWAFSWIQDVFTPTLIKYLTNNKQTANLLHRERNNLHVAFRHLQCLLF